MLYWVKKLGYLCNCKSEISNVCNTVKNHCRQVMKIVHHDSNGRFDLLISGYQSVNYCQINTKDLRLSILWMLGAKSHDAICSNNL